LFGEWEIKSKTSSRVKPVILDLGGIKSNPKSNSMLTEIEPTIISMELVAEKESDQQNNNNNSEKNNNTSYAQALVDSHDYNNKESDEFRERQARDLKAGLHPSRFVHLPKIVHKFVFWYTRRTLGMRSQTPYEDNIKKIVDFTTVEAFWVCYCHLARPATLPSPTDLHLFKDGIRPLWEDSANCHGGKWIIRFKKAVSGRFWRTCFQATFILSVDNILNENLEVKIYAQLSELFYYPPVVLTYAEPNSIKKLTRVQTKELLVLALVGDQLDYGENICGAVLSIRFNEDILSVWNRNASDHQAVMALRDAIKRNLKLPHSYLMEYKPHDASLRDNSSYRNTWLRELKNLWVSIIEHLKYKKHGTSSLLMIIYHKTH
ncbi:novel cap-binding protein, partial [Prunus dulcis]